MRGLHFFVEVEVEKKPGHFSLWKQTEKTLTKKEKIIFVFTVFSGSTWHISTRANSWWSLTSRAYSQCLDVSCKTSECKAPCESPADTLSMRKEKASATAQLSDPKGHYASIMVVLICFIDLTKATIPGSHLPLIGWYNHRYHSSRSHGWDALPKDCRFWSMLRLLRSMIVDTKNLTNLRVFLSCPPLSPRPQHSGLVHKLKSKRIIFEIRRFLTASSLEKTRVWLQECCLVAFAEMIADPIRIAPQIGGAFDLFPKKHWLL